METMKNQDLQALEQIGGILEVDWRESDGHVRMTGPSHTVFEGVLYL